MVRAVVFRISGADDIDDLVQETFVHLWKGLESFAGQAAPRTWIYRIAVNAALDHCRKRSKWKLTEIADSFADGRNQEHSSMQRDLVSKGLATLSTDHRTVLVLQTMEGLSHAEIAQVLEIPEGTVRSRLHHAKERFLEFLKTEKVEL